MTAVKSVSAKPLTGFEKKKTLEHNGCEFVKINDTNSFAAPKAMLWACYFDGIKIAEARLQIDCVNAAIEALGGE
ncbi:hypothetical protein phiK7B1_132 [Pseudomonas phage phiK7B1]|nr:hypothetical protein phiK7B1_132 [Pseudomonas phage phiK7B1]UIS24693.1 hypothetical protein S21ZY_131 [Pseudomonas phage ZY21]